MECSERFDKLSILFVEDQKKIVELMENAISDLFAHFYVAYDGLDGLEQFENFHIDIVISDIMMPKMDGLEMTKRIKQKNEEVSVIILSAFSEKERLLSAIDIGVDKYLIKPIDPEELLDTICDLAQKRHIGEVFIPLCHNFRFDSEKIALFRGNELIPLTGRELKFIQLLCQNRDKHASHREIKRKVWKDGSLSSAALRAFIKRLRAKTDKELIINIPKVGYKISTNLS